MSNLARILTVFGLLAVLGGCTAAASVFDNNCSGNGWISPGDDFCAVYHKPTTQPQLILKRRTQTDDYVVLARAWQAANDKARELGWIV